MSLQAAGNLLVKLKTSLLNSFMIRPHGNLSRSPWNGAPYRLSEENQCLIPALRGLSPSNGSPQILGEMTGFFNAKRGDTGFFAYSACPMVERLRKLFVNIPKDHPCFEWFVQIRFYAFPARKEVTA